MFSKNSALLVAAIVFLIMALAHLIRLNYHTLIFVGPYAIPMQVSLIAFIVSLVLAIWMFVARSRKR